MKLKLTPFKVDDPELLELVSPDMSRWLNSWPAKEQTKYGGMYVAVGREKRVIAADKSAGRLRRKLEKLGRSKVLIFYMERPDAYVIYALCP